MMKQMNIPYYNNSNIEVLTSKIIITITAKIIKIIKLPREKIQKKLTEQQIRIKIKIIIIALIMKKAKLNQRLKTHKNFNKGANKKYNR